MPVTRSQTRRANALAAALGPSVTQPTCRRSQRLLRTANNTVEHAPVPPPPAAPTLRRSRRLQGYAATPPPPTPPPRARDALPPALRLVLEQQRALAQRRGRLSVITNWRAGNHYNYPIMRRDNPPGQVRGQPRVEEGFLWAMI